ncbi:YopX family protein [Bacillus cereus]
MKEIRYQVYTKDWTGVTKLFDLNALHCTKEGRDGLKVIFYNSAEAIESQIVGKDKIRQYTGLKDKNGKEIYEGDIVQISGHPFQGSINIDGIYEVGYNELMELCCGGWYLHRMRHWAEVIGNKFENPELLKGADKNE